MKIVIKIWADGVSDNQTLVMTGNRYVLGNWNPSQAPQASRGSFPLWHIELDAAQLDFPLEYKFCIVNRADRSLVCWEEGENRRLEYPVGHFNDDETFVVRGLHFRGNLPVWRCAGVVIPVFSLRSEHSFGIGDFGDLRRFVDWAKIVDMKVIQILPVNDTMLTRTRRDSYPYNAVSIYALHPLYLDLNAMGKLHNEERNRFFREKQIELNSLPDLDYEQVCCYKELFFKELYLQDGAAVLASEAYRLFFEKNQTWLPAYARFSQKRDGDANPPEFYCFLQFHADRQLAQARDYCRANGILLKGDIPIGVSKTSVEAQTEPQYFNLDMQAGAPPDDFSAAGQNWQFPTYRWEAMEADGFAWWKRRFRKMADYFDAYRIDHILGFFRIWEIPESSVEGILGCFSPAMPLAVDEIVQTGFRFDPIKHTRPSISETNLQTLFGDSASEVKHRYFNQLTANRFALKSEYDTQRKIQNRFDGKTDAENQSVMKKLFAVCNEVLFIEDRKQSGKFHPRITAYLSFVYKELDDADRMAFDTLYHKFFYLRHNQFWKEQAIRRLRPLVDATDMLACGEDLGMIPQSVPEVMEELQILSLEIERMPKAPDVALSDLKNLPYLSVCATSTHDMSTLRGWWNEQQQEDPAPEICEQILIRHLQSPAMLCIFPWQDWMSIDGELRRTDIDAERINIPADPHHYWRYRMHITIEKLLQADELNDKIRRLISFRLF